MHNPEKPTYNHTNLQTTLDVGVIEHGTSTIDNPLVSHADSYRISDALIEFARLPLDKATLVLERLADNEIEQVESKCHAVREERKALAYQKACAILASSAGCQITPEQLEQMLKGVEPPAKEKVLIRKKTNPHLTQEEKKKRDDSVLKLMSDVAVRGVFNGNLKDISQKLAIPYGSMAATLERLKADNRLEVISFGVYRIV